MGRELFFDDPQVCPAMRFQLIGVNHKSAPLEVRERLAIPESRLPDACRDLTAYPGIEEGMVISTCNRVEVVTHTTNGSADLRGFLHDHFQLKAEELDAHLYEFREKDAVRHVFRVASSLDSMVVGEAQILGQVKEAYATARAIGAVRGQLDQLFSRAFAVAKRVRTETAVGSSSVSIASVAVELAKKIFGSLQGKNVFIVGAGKMSELAARHLMAHGCASIFVSNRTYDRAVGLAQKFDGQAIKFDDLYETCDRADIVITSTGAPHAIFRREHGEQFLARRKNRPMFFIDIAVPRDVSQDMAKLDGIFTYDIDDLQQAVTSHVADRHKEAELAEAIIASEVEKFEARFEARVNTLDVVPTIVSLQDHLETIRQAEIDRVRGRMGHLTPEQEMAVEALTRGIINKVMHTPITTLKSAARESEATTIVDVVKRLFNLQGKEKNQQTQSAAKKDEVGTRR
jgi:glutamyl-tRNA reductase